MVFGWVASWITTVEYCSSFWKAYEWWLRLRLFVCDYQIPRTDELDFIIVDAESLKDAEARAADELKTLNIPKRYILNIEEVL